MWFVFALLSAVFAALTSVLAKVGIEGVNSNLATALRTCVVLAMAWLMVFITLILAVIFLHEDFTVKSAIGAVLITAGTVLMVL